MDNLFSAWREFRRGKRKKLEVQKFEFKLEDNLFKLHEELKSKSYFHSSYQNFYVCDPKLRHIHKASVRDRIIHQAVFRILYQIFDKGFIYDFYSCRFYKGTHKAVSRLEVFVRKASNNYKKPIFVLKCDIKKFFDSVNQSILTNLIEKRIKDESVLWLIKEIIDSFEAEKDVGLPLGNVTSQLFANIYLDELDQFMKHGLKVEFYLRYCDDFVIIGENKDYLMALCGEIDKFIRGKLNLSLHKKKIIIRKYAQGIDFLGYVSFPHYRVLRTKTKRRVLRKISQRKYELARELLSEESFNQTLQSYLGVLKHCHGFKIKQKISNK